MIGKLRRYFKSFHLDFNLGFKIVKHRIRFETHKDALDYLHKDVTVFFVESPDIHGKLKGILYSYDMNGKIIDHLTQVFVAGRWWSINNVGIK